jgi:hypothetical protein
MRQQTAERMTEDQMPGKVLLFLFGIAVLAVAACDYAWLQGFGFPDGHLTDLDRARIPLHSAFIGLSIVCGLALLGLGALTSGAGRRKGAFSAIAVYALIVFTTLAIDRYLASYLDAGVGG